MLPAEMPPMFPILPGLPDILAETVRRSGRRFGPRVSPISGNGEFHNGVDLGCAIGTPIYCPWDGTVELAKHTGMGGNQINIVHFNGLCSKFLHLNQFGVYQGRHLKAGDIIGATGNTGASTGPHLHFSLMDASLRNDQRRSIDPEHYYLNPLAFLECTIDVLSHAFEPVEEHP
jgi:murein DD-endopeptidase MepM/ murein hydrolase activator NlpD